MGGSNRKLTGRFAPKLEAQVGVWVRWLAKNVALTGGLILMLIVLLTVVSVTGRAFIWLGLGPVPGDFELVEAGTAFAVFAFLPWCQLQRGHVTVDIILEKFGMRTKACFELLSNILMAFIATIIVWRLVLGLIEKQKYHETTFILQFPVWWSYSASCLGASIFCLVTWYTVWRSANAVTGQTPAPSVDQ